MKTATQAQVAELLEKETKGLKESRDAVLREKKQLEDRFKDVDPDEYRTLKTSKRNAEDKDSDPIKLRERIEAEFAPKLTAAEKRAEELEAKLNANIVDGSLTTALTEAGVAPEFIRAVKADFRGSRKIEVTEGGALVDGKPVTDYVKAWAASDEAKPFIAAANNQGGGSKGGAGGGATGKKAADMTAKEKAAYIGQHGAEAFKNKVDNER